MSCGIFPDRFSHPSEESLARGFGPRGDIRAKLSRRIYEVVVVGMADIRAGNKDAVYAEIAELLT